MKLPLDHVGVLGPDIRALVEEFRDLGFNVVGPEELKAVDADGVERSLNQHSAHVMFADSYIELTSVTRATPDHHLAAYLRPPWGLRLLILGSDDIDSSRARAESNGLAPGAVQHAQREIQYGSGGTARFRWFALPSEGGGEALVACAQHDTPERVFQPVACAHRNSATTITTLYARDSETTALLAPLAGRNGIDVIELAGRAGEVMTPPLAGLRIAVTRLSDARENLARRGKVATSVADGVAVALDCGLVIVFGEDAAA